MKDSLQLLNAHRILHQYCSRECLHIRLVARLLEWKHVSGGWILQDDINLSSLQEADVNHSQGSLTTQMIQRTFLHLDVGAYMG